MVKILFPGIIIGTEIVHYMMNLTTKNHLWKIKSADMVIAGILEAIP